jgi:amino acid adenylation domain-containing protein
MNRLLQHGPSAQADRRPEATALVFRGEALSYGALETDSNRLARLLLEAGCERGDRVALMTPKSLPAVVAMLGTLKADCAYVPVDPSIPGARAARILARTDPRLVLADGYAQALVEEVLSNEAFRGRLRVGWLGRQPPEGKTFRPLFLRNDIDACSPTPRDYKNTVSDAAHILFTSGSTGEPKGVVITHGSVQHFLDWAIGYFGMTTSDRSSGHSPLQFDLSTFDIYGSLTAGATLHLVSPELNLLPHKLASFIRESELTHWLSVPSILNYMAKLDAVRDGDFPTLKRLLWCGEVFPTPALIYWMSKLPHVTFTNLYGPTETTIASSYYTVPKCPRDENEPTPIGTACPGEELLVLDETLEPVQRGGIGDLYIRGVGLSPGYWRDSEKTAAAFLSNPTGHDPEDRIYRTGDLARVGEDGLLYYLGRSDSQIKSRGYRIELQEIERTANTVSSLVEVAVVGAKSESLEGTAICCAYVAPPESEVTPASLRSRLRRELPAYMLPSRWMAMKRLPKNASGKIDRCRLREMFEQQMGSLG